MVYALYTAAVIFIQPTKIKIEKVVKTKTNESQETNNQKKKKIQIA